MKLMKYKKKFLLGITLIIILGLSTIIIDKLVGINSLIFMSNLDSKKIGDKYNVNIEYINGEGLDRIYECRNVEDNSIVYLISLYRQKNIYVIASDSGITRDEAKKIFRTNGSGVDNIELHMGAIYDDTPLLENIVEKLYWTNKVTDSDLGSPYIEFSSGEFYDYRFYKNR